MKYIKKFEKKFENNLYLFSRLEVGDYVLLDTYVDARIIKNDNARVSSADRFNDNFRVPSRYAKIIKLASIPNNRFRYKVLIITDELKMIELWITDSSVIRKLSSDEISEFETKENAIKFNI